VDSELAGRRNKDRASYLSNNPHRDGVPGKRPEMAKIAIGGPPHSGKTVLMGLLRALLPRDKFVVVEAAPDGEGITG